MILLGRNSLLRCRSLGMVLLKKKKYASTVYILGCKPCVSNENCWHAIRHFIRKCMFISLSVFVDGCCIKLCSSESTEVSQGQHYSLPHRRKTYRWRLKSSKGHSLVKSTWNYGDYNHLITERPEELVCRSYTLYFLLSDSMEKQIMVRFIRI